MKKVALLIALISTVLLSSSCNISPDQSNTSQPLHTTDKQEGVKVSNDDAANSPDKETDMAASRNDQQEIETSDSESQTENTSMDISATDSLIRSPEGKNLSQVEWTPGAPDVSLPMKFGKTKAELVIGRDHPNGTKAIVYFPSSSVGWSLDMSGADNSEAFEDYGDLQEGYKMQAALHDFDQDGINELIVAAGNSLIDECIWVYSFTTVGDLRKINPINQELSITGQAYIVLDGKELMAPYGSQGLFDSYKYVDKQFMQPVY
ncbi:MULTISPECIES: hypothetical protein [Paenibacillus]|uniref:hypothetical protein n=1 Tax=Paenibacillus TaxID=44249 RepID=UPI001B10867B|nr:MULTISPECIES: hypothetical protein [Paenibacillus]UYO06448.1 hypothetical protein K2F33_11500 [Paenibacillus sp. PSB04]GIO64074.1 hypothetical protein J43TS9_56480 [Paenibacillus cineris]